MKPLTEASWLTAPETCAVMAALEAAKPGGARFVGGCVRNTLMGRPVDDIDIATQLSPEEALKALETAGIRAIPTGLAHGTVTAIVDHIPFEITSLRRDVETDGRRAVVAFTQNWAEDAERRDFRLNAIYADAAGQLYDPTGRGIEDAQAGRIVFIGDADERLREDYLRILRFFRFNAWYGGDLNQEGLAACARQKEGLDQIAVERIWKELKKLLAAPDPVCAIEAMDKCGVLAKILPGPSNPDRLHDLRVSEMLMQAKPDPMQRFMALIEGGEPAEAVACIKAFKLSNKEAERVRLLASATLPEEYKRSAKALRQTLYQLGAQVLIDKAMLSGEDVRDLVAACKAWRRPVFPLNGEDVLKAGLKPGPEMGHVLRTLEIWWVSGDFTAGRADLLEELERRIKAD